MEIDGKPKKLSWRDLEVLTDSFSKENFIVNVQFGKLYRGKTSDAQELTVKIWWLPPDEVCTIALGDGAIVDRLEVYKLSIYLTIYFILQERVLS